MMQREWSRCSNASISIDVRGCKCNNERTQPIETTKIIQNVEHTCIYWSFKKTKQKSIGKICAPRRESSRNQADSMRYCGFC